MQNERQRFILPLEFAFSHGDVVRAMITRLGGTVCKNYHYRRTASVMKHPYKFHPGLDVFVHLIMILK